MANFTAFLLLYGIYMCRICTRVNMTVHKASNCNQIIRQHVRGRTALSRVNFKLGSFPS